MPRSTRSSWGSNKPARRKGYRTLRYWADEHDGRGYMRHTKTIEGSKRDGDRELARLQLLHGRDAPSPTIREAWDAWFVPDAMAKMRAYEEHKKPGKKGETLKPQSWAQIRSAWKVHVEPRWGDVRASDVRYTDIQLWLDTKTEQVAQRCLSILKGVLRFCLLNDAIDKNVAEYSFRMPTKAAKRDDGVWPLDFLLNKVWPAVYGTPCEAAFIMYAFNGCRSGEGLAPMLDEIEPITIKGMTLASIPITRQVHDNGKVSSEGDLKNQWSPRQTVLPPPFSTRILELKAMGEAAGNEWLSDNGLHEPISQIAIRKTFYNALDKAGIERREMRSLRRSWRSWIAVKGISPEILEKMMGHVGEGTTGRHYLKVDADLIAQELFRVFNGNEIKVEWMH